MTGDTFEYAIRKDVRNNPIVREIDRERHLEMWRSAGTGVFLVLVLLFSAWQHFEQLQQGYELEAMQTSLAEAEVVNGRLRVQLEQLQALDRIQRYAEDKLGMRAPSDDEVEVVPRVTQPPAPPSTLAQR